MLQRILSFLASLLGYVFGNLSSLVTATHESTPTHTVLLHTSPVVRYRGPQTYLPISVVAHNVDERDLRANTSAVVEGIRITLVRRGWRAGLFGWTAARYLGVRTDGGVEVTPASVKRWDVAHDGAAQADSLDDYDSHKLDDEDDPAPLELPTPTVSSKRQTSFDKQLKHLAMAHGVPPGHVVSTHLVRLPVSSGDGYFRLCLQVPDSAGGGKRRSLVTAYSPTFRLFSLSLSSACPRGSSVLPPTIVPELLLRTLSTALLGSLFALSPLALLADKVLPSSVGRWLLRRLYRALGGDEKRAQAMQRWNAGQRWEQLKRLVDSGVPWSGAGIRTAWEIERDEKRQRGGVSFVR